MTLTAIMEAHLKNGPLSLRDCIALAVVERMIDQGEYEYPHHFSGAFKIADAVLAERTKVDPISDVREDS